MDNTNTQPVSNTANPQTAVPADGASNAAEFQSTAPSETLRNEVDNLTVQETGEPLAGGANQSSGSGLSTGWVISVGLLIVVGLVVLVKLIKEAREEGPVTSVKANAAAGPAKAAKQPAKKTASKRKQPAAKRKKSTKKRR